MLSLKELIKTYGHIDDLENYKRPLFVGPHPDDIEFGCGGLISKYKEKGTIVTYCIVTDGGAGSEDINVTGEELAKIRMQESIKAANYLNVKNIEFLNFEDGGDFRIEDVVKQLSKVVLKYKPDIIFAPDSRLKSECHSDHIKTGEAVRRVSQIVSHPESLRRHHVDISGIDVFPKNITLAFYFSDDANKKVYFEEENLKQKIDSLLFHESQMNNEESELLINYFKLMALELGEGKGFAEEYQVLLPLTQHVYAKGVHYEE